MRLLALVGAVLVLLVAAPAPALAVSPASPLTLHPPALLGGAESPGLLGPSGATPGRRLGSIRHANLLITGLGLMAGGLIAGAAGFAILYYCDPVGTLACTNQGTLVLGWVLAAPGVLPLAVGSILVYISIESGGRYSAAPRKGLMALSVTPVPGGGGMVETTFRF